MWTGGSLFIPAKADEVNKVSKVSKVNRVNKVNKDDKVGKCLFILHLIPF